MCLNPIYSQKEKLIDRMTGEVSYRMKFKDFDMNKPLIPLACGKCFECQKQKAREWSYRIMNEEAYYEKSCFITLTYRNAPNELVKKDLQDFIKRLRRRLEPKKIRYFACGEYGSKGHRPHFHIILFGWCPDDLKYFSFTKKKDKIYRSEFIESLWKFGFSSVGFVNENTAKYCANYCQKLNQVEGKVKPFVCMSTHPGIGYRFILDNQHLINSDKLYSHGYSIKLPRYYNDVLKRLDIFKYEPKIEANLKLREQRALFYDVGFENLKAKKKRLNAQLLN